MEKTTVLKLENLNAGYQIKKGFVKAVDGISFELKKGEFLGIAGESGCGKSTLAYAIMNLMRDNARIKSGSIVLNDVDIAQKDEEAMKKIRWVDLSMVFQSAMNALNPVLKIGDQLTDAIFAHDKNATKETAEKRAKEVMNLVDISPDRFDSYPHQLSGGMKQRVMIAMALILQPDLIIMDEPTTALDVVVQRTIIEKIQELQKQFDFAVIFITHDLSLLVEISHKLAIMYAGKIIEFGAAEKVFTKHLHPYTEGLMSSFPSLTGPIIRMGGIDGKPPDLLNPPQGCRFAPRCNQAMDICFKDYPERYETGDHYVHCHLYNTKGGDVNE
ncbi:MAG TPA: ABC transporter ATP-binding protein [Thermotogota bacterium]|nr:ABC transporter ATP-binding protein [Thermotogota bacterium]HPR95709.1 ABC transporter ATP-binding protein [Thermotogota bacterium]